MMNPLRVYRTPPAELAHTVLMHVAKARALVALASENAEWPRNMTLDMAEALLDEAEALIVDMEDGFAKEASS
jgi:hypothetical protein